MKHAVSSLEGALLDAAVAKIEGWRWEIVPEATSPIGRTFCLAHIDNRSTDQFEPSRLWVDGGPIIERERIGLDRGRHDAPPEEKWWADAGAPKASVEAGPTALIAAMRAYVASKFGEEVELT